MSAIPTDPSALLEDLFSRARRAGATDADGVFAVGRSQSVSQRLGAPEAVERSESGDLQLRVFVGKRSAAVSSSDFSGDTLSDMVERVMAMAKVAPEDPYAGLADAEQVGGTGVEIEMFDPTEPSAETLVERARIAEDAARAVPGVTNSEGAEAGWGVSEVTVAATNGFSGTYRRSSFSIVASVLAGEGQKMERDYEYTAKVFDGDLADPAEVGRTAGERAVKRLNPRKAKTASLPVIFEPRASRSILGHLSGAINGASIARGTSFLKDDMGKTLFGPAIRIFDDPHRTRGFRSRPFDSEGVATHKRAVIDGGALTTWILDCATARQLGMETTGHAARMGGGGMSPSASNLFLEAGDLSPEELIRETGTGLYITEMMGSSVSLITGDYSRGAAGFWIENGELTYPVSEVTIAGHLREIFKSMTPANDLTFKYGTDAPTVRIEGLTIAGA
jgi:PmbA protein